MDYNKNVQSVVNACLSCDIELAVKSFMVEQSDKFTNAVREKIDLLSDDKQRDIQSFFYHILNVCYGGSLFLEDRQKQDSFIEKLDEKDMFLLKENVIYFLGRLSIIPDIKLLKKIYDLDDNKYIKLNLTFSSLFTFCEDIEMDFISRFAPDNDYDVMLRSWTMAYFKDVENPYQYVDLSSDDWEVAKIPRIKRLAINDEENPNFLKAMSFRLLDLLVLDLFLENRKRDDLTSDDKQIVQDAFIDYYRYSDQKKEKLRELKQKILRK